MPGGLALSSGTFQSLHDDIFVEPACDLEHLGRPALAGLWSLYGSQMELDTPSTIFKILAEEVLGGPAKAGESVPGAVNGHFHKEG